MTPIDAYITRPRPAASGFGIGWAAVGRGGGGCCAAMSGTCVANPRRMSIRRWLSLLAALVSAIGALPGARAAAIGPLLEQPVLAVAGGPAGGRPRCAPRRAAR